MTELKPCPFCGREAEIIAETKRNIGFTIWCECKEQWYALYASVSIQNGRPCPEWTEKLYVLTAEQNRRLTL